MASGKPGFGFSEACAGLWASASDYEVRLGFGRIGSPDSGTLLFLPLLSDSVVVRPGPALFSPSRRTMAVGANSIVLAYFTQ